MAIKAVIFDGGGVVVEWQETFRRFSRLIKVDYNALLQAYLRFAPEPEIGKQSFDWHLQMTMKDVGQIDRWRELRQIVPKGFTRIEPTFQLLKELQGKFKRALLTNADLGVKEELDQYIDYLKYFEVVIDSSVVKLRKPGAEIFYLTCKSLSLRPKECLFVDDFIENVAAAEKLGFKTIHFKDPVSSVKLIRKTLYEKI